MNFVIKLSKEGHDVESAENENLNFSSELASHSIYNVYTATKGATDTSVTVTHSLGFVPKVWIFRQENDGIEDYYRRLPRLSTVSSANAIDYYITDSTVVIETSNNVDAMTFKVVVFTRSPNI